MGADMHGTRAAFETRSPRGRPVRDCLVAALVWLAALIIAGVFAWIVGEVVWRGVGQLSWSFLVGAPERAGRAGGIGPIIVSTGLIVLVCLAVALPLGLGTAILLAEFTRSRSRSGRLIRLSLDVLAGVPSIVFGLFGNAFFSVVLELGFSILSGGLTLACMILPLLIRSIELSLRSVSDDHRLAAAALGISKARLLTQVLLPAAAPGIVAGLTLGMARALSETAALIFTSGYVDRMPHSLHDSGRSLSVHIYDLALNVAGGEPNASASALVLIIILFVMNLLAFSLTDRLLARRALA
jgi:phosphate transport system permease protein